ncbi:MAG: glycoside hydrolase family 76 protein [Promethearchaeota archaeon]
MKQKTLAIIITVIISAQIFLVIPSIVLAELDVNELTTQSSEINAEFQEKLFKDEVTDGLEGLGDNEGNKFGGTDTFAIENSIATAAFFTRYARSGNAECDSWGEDDTFPAVSNLEANNMLERSEDLFYVADQGIALEFLSVAYDHSQNQEMLTKLENVYSSIDNFESNDTAGYNGYKGGYWKAITKDGIKYKTNEEAYKYCFTNNTFWVIIGLLNFGLNVKGLSIDNDEQYSITSVEISEKLIEFCEDECFFNGSGFMEYPYADMAEPEKNNYYFNTQALAVLAYTRLYQATGKQQYLDRANLFVNYIIAKNFLDTGKVGGYISYYSQSTGKRSNIKIGFDQALYAYALINLYVATGETSQAHLSRLHEVVKFMNDKMYKKSKDGEIVGYVELMVDDEIPDDYELRYWRTNALMMLVNEEMQWYSRPWYIKYLMWIIIGAVAVAGIILIVVLVRRRRNIGTKLPKMVKGLVED